LWAHSGSLGQKKYFPRPKKDQRAGQLQNRKKGTKLDAGKTGARGRRRIFATPKRLMRISHCGCFQVEAGDLADKKTAGAVAAAA